ncbi:MAG: hypothetical protein ACKVHE_31090, partial [Planctomycetales bacterium]
KVPHSTRSYGSLESPISPIDLVRQPWRRRRNRLPTTSAPFNAVRFLLANRQFWAAERPTIPNLELRPVAQTERTKRIAVGSL